MIASSDSLKAFIEQIKKCDSIAIDTEFVWERTYFPKLGLIQIALPDGTCELIDPIAIDDLSPLGEILSSPSIVKILHDASQDLTILQRETGHIPVNIFDTRLAAGFYGLLSTISLQNLLKEVVDIDLPKTESRTDWTRRPLSDKQLEYAVDDVKFLHEVKDIMEKKVEEKNLTSWLQEELNLLNNPKIYAERDPMTMYKKVKAFGRLNSRGLAILRELAAWREKTAIEQDLPRKHTISDESLLILSQDIPQTIGELKNTQEIYGKRLRLYGDDILAAVKRGKDLPAEDCPVSPTPPENRNEIRRRVKEIKSYIASHSEKFHIDPALIANRAELESLADQDKPINHENSRQLNGWRFEFLGHDQLQRLTGHRL